VPRNRSRDLIRVGDRDGWVCGICRDTARLVHRPLGAVTILASDLTLEDVPGGAQADEAWEDVELTTRRYDPLAASIDHIVPKSRGGTDDDGNLQITHLRCNLLKHDQAQPSPEYARARLSLTLDGTPVPFGVWRRAAPLPRRGTPARRVRKLPPAWMIERGQVAVEPWRLIIRYRVWRRHRRHRQRRQAARDALS
jgi:HNH endonuclease